MSVCSVGIQLLSQLRGDLNRVGLQVQLQSGFLVSKRLVLLDDVDVVQFGCEALGKGLVRLAVLLDVRLALDLLSDLGGGKVPPEQAAL